MTATAVLVLLGVQGALGAFDTTWYHEWRGRLPARPEARPELALHCGRSLVYAVVYLTMPWTAWTGAAGVVLAALLVAEAVITFTDFVVEDRVRAPQGGVFPGERVMHGLMAVVHGAILAGLVPVLAGWISGSSSTALGAGHGSGLLVALTVGGAGCLLSGARDGLAAAGVRAAAWPWPAVASAESAAHLERVAGSMTRPPGSRPPTERRRRLALALTVLAVVAARTHRQP